MNNINPKVTVRMSAYNHEKYVEQAILSIVNQTYQDFELLVIDDGSKDQTPVILERLSKEYGFYFERQENMGLPKTLNKLTKMAKGEYITGCASDDAWPKDRVEKQLKAITDANHSIDIVHGEIIKIYENGSTSARVESKLIEGRKALSDFLKRKKKFYTVTMMSKTSLHNDISGYDENIYTEDYDWLIRALKNGASIYAIKDILCYYRSHEENWTKTNNGIKKIIKSEISITKKLTPMEATTFVYHSLPYWLEYCNIIKSKYRFGFALLTPLYIIHKKFIREIIKIIK